MSGGKQPCHRDAPALVMSWCHGRQPPAPSTTLVVQQPCHSRQTVGGGHVTGWLVTQPAPVGIKRAVPAQAGGQAGSLARWGRGGQGRAERLLHRRCFSCALQLDIQTGMQPDHSMVLSSPSGELSKLYRTGKHPITVLQGAGSSPEPRAAGARHPFALGSQGLAGPHVISWHHPWWWNGLVTVGRTLVTATGGLGGVSAGRQGDMGWRALAGGWENTRQGGKGSPWRWRVVALVADSAVLWQPQLWIWDWDHSLCHSAKECCNFLKGKWSKI